MDAIKQFIEEYPDISEDTLNSLAEYFRDKNNALSRAIQKLLEKDVKSAVFILKNVMNTTISIDVSSIASLLLAKLIFSRLIGEEEQIFVKTLKDLKSFLQDYDRVFELLKGVREIYRSASSKLAQRISERLMRLALNLWSSQKNVVLSSILLRYALKFAELANDCVMIGKIKYNLALILMKSGKVEEPKKLAKEAYKIFERLSQISQKYVKNYEVAKKLCEKLNCL